MVKFTISKMDIGIIYHRIGLFQNRKFKGKNNFEIFINSRIYMYAATSLPESVIYFGGYEVDASCGFLKIFQDYLKFKI